MYCPYSVSFAIIKACNLYDDTRVYILSGSNLNQMQCVPIGNATTATAMEANKINEKNIGAADKRRVSEPYLPK